MASWLILAVPPAYLATLMIGRRLIAGKSVESFYPPPDDRNFRLVVAAWILALVMFAFGVFFMRDDNLSHNASARILGGIVVVLGLIFSLWAQTELSYMRRTGGVLRKQQDRVTGMKLMRRGIIASCAGLMLIVLSPSIGVGLLALALSIYIPASDELSETSG